MQNITGQIESFELSLHFNDCLSPEQKVGGSQGEAGEASRGGGEGGRPGRAGERNVKLFYTLGKNF